MLESYIPIIAILIFAVIFAIVCVKLSSLMGPRRPGKEKYSTYESGMEPIETARRKFSVKFYLVAVSFLLFDLEIVFLYPWAVSFIKYGRAEMIYTLIVAIIFILILVIGLLYEYKKGAFKWD